MARPALSLKLIAKPLLLLVGLTGGVLALHLLPFGAILKSHAHARPDLDDIAGFIGLGALACAVGMPRQIVAFAAGFAWGVTIGVAIALAAQIIGCAADLFWARLIARNFVQSRLRGRARSIDRALTRRPFIAALTLRLMPVGNNLLLNLLAGVSTVPAGGFLLGSAIGFIPQTVIFALLGSGSRIARATQIEIGFGFFLISTAVGIALLLAERHRMSRPMPNALECEAAISETTISPS
ncbi:TVP38/TMEM64 family protein [Acidiphilium sp.]|uniref:TVP38/TMEM64 family protein n=1 Tax=Acidiphilium sp. TaxID=527 RepID=UPI003D004BCC